MYDPYNVFNFCKSTVKEIKNDLHILNFKMNIFLREITQMICLKV